MDEKIGFSLTAWIWVLYFFGVFQLVEKPTTKHGDRGRGRRRRGRGSGSRQTKKIIVEHKYYG